MLAPNAARAAPAVAGHDPHEIDRAGRQDRIRNSTVPNTTATDGAHKGRAWWRAEARRVGSDWPAVLALHTSVVATWRARHDPDDGARHE
jgi:hypothetical protein